MKIISREKQPPVKTFKEPVDLVDTHEDTIYMLQFANQKYYEKLAIACFTITAQLKYKQNREETTNLEIQRAIKEIEKIWNDKQKFTHVGNLAKKGKSHSPYEKKDDDQKQ